MKQDPAFKYKYLGSSNSGERTPILPSSQQRPRQQNAASSITTATAPSLPRIDSNSFIPKTSRPRKKISQFRKKSQEDFATWKGRIGVHVKVDEFDIKVISEHILKTLPGWNVVDHYDVIRLWRQQQAPNGDGQHEQHMMSMPLSDDESGGKNEPEFDAAMPEVFVFSFGAVVFWNFPNAQWEEDWIEKHLFCFPDACGAAHKPSAIEEASDDITFVYGDKFTIKRDVVQLSTSETGQKLAVSFAIAKSSLVSIYEWRLERTIERNSHIPEELAKNGRIHMSQQEIGKEVGRIFLVKHGINLDSSLIDTPEEFWEDDRFEGSYEETLRYLGIAKRLGIVNNRLDTLQDLHQVLTESVQNHHAAHLEWIIIWLILIEVLLEVFRFGFF